MTKDEALKLALEALQNPWKAGPDGVADAIIAIKEALAQPEPVYHLRQYGDVTKAEFDRYLATGDINTTPPQRPWVGLTYKEVQEIHDTYHRRMGPQEFASMIEAKLRSKNEHV